MVKRRRRNSSRLPRPHLVARRRIARLYEYRSFEAVVVVRDLAMAVPGDRLAWIERVFADEDVRAFRDDVNGADFVRLGPSLAQNPIVIPIFAIG